MTRAAARLATLAADWHTRPMSGAVLGATRRATLDWFATTLPGTIRSPATLLASGASGTGGGNAICYADGRRTGARTAAFVNAVASHTVEFDDIFRDGGYHPGSPTIAAALAVAQDIGASREAFDRAVIAGYEAGCRLSLAIQPSHYAFWHTTSTVGTVGAAVAGAMILRCDERAIGNAISIASSFAGGHQQNLVGSGMAKALHAGHAADAGLLAAYSASAGATGAADALDGAKGYAAATSDGSGDWDAAFDGAGDWTPITRMTVKMHGCCGHIFPALDGLAALRTAIGFGPDDICSLRIEGYAATRDMCDRPEPADAQAARFSLQYCLAAQMVLGSVRLAAFEPVALADPRIRRIMPRMSVETAADLAAEYPRRRMARLHLSLSDGRQFTHFQPMRKGDPEDPISDADLIAKFRELAAEALDPDEIDCLLNLVRDGRAVPGAVHLEKAA